MKSGEIFLERLSLIANTPLLVLKLAGGSILILLNIWLFSGVASILSATMGFSFLDTLSLTVTGTIVLVMIAGIEKGYKTSGNEFTKTEKFNIRIMWFVGLACYFISILFSFIGVWQTIRGNGGLYTYYSFDWFGLVKSIKIEKTITWTSFIFILFKSMLAGFVDYIAGILIQDDIDRIMNPTVKQQENNGNKGLGGLEKRFEDKIKDFDKISFNSRNDINKAQNLIDEMRRVKNQVKGIDPLRSKEMEKKIEQLDKELTNRKNEL